MRNNEETSINRQNKSVSDNIGETGLVHRLQNMVGSIKENPGKDSKQFIVNVNREAELAKNRRVHFAVMAIEASAKKLNIPGQKMFSRLRKQNLINDRLIKYYESLHTQSLNWVVEDTIESLNNWEKEERTNNKSNIYDKAISRHLSVNPKSAGKNRKKKP